MIRAKARRKRSRGAIDQLPSGAVRVRVYAGIDAVSKRRINLTGIVPADPKAQVEAEKALTRLLRQVDERRNRRTTATVYQLMDRWLKVLDVEASTRAQPPSLPHPEPRPPSIKDAARLAAETWKTDPDWGNLRLGRDDHRRSTALCTLRWDHVDLNHAVIDLRRAIGLGDHGRLVEKQTQTHQQRRVVLDPESVKILTDHRGRCTARADMLGIELAADAYVFSPTPDGRTHPAPDTIGQRYDRMAHRFRIDTTLHKLRHYSATELIRAGVDVRTIAGRLGHGGGGATTLRVYTAWLSEADQRAAPALAAQCQHATRTRPRPSPGVPSRSRPRRSAGPTNRSPST